MPHSEARGLSDLGLFEEALSSLGQLPGHHGRSPDALLLALHCCAKTCVWPAGNRIARVLLLRSDPRCTLKVAGFYFELAAFQLANGDEPGAQRSATLALSIDHRIQDEIRNVPALAAVLLAPRTVRREIASAAAVLESFLWLPR